MGFTCQVIDEDLETGKQFRRFLAYDIILLMEKDYLAAPFEVGWLPCEWPTS